MVDFIKQLTVLVSPTDVKPKVDGDEEERDDQLLEHDFRNTRNGDFEVIGVVIEIEIQMEMEMAMRINQKVMTKTRMMMIITMMVMTKMKTRKMNKVELEYRVNL